MDVGTRGELLDRLAGAIESVTTLHPVRVAVDGPPVSAAFEQIVDRARTRDLALLGSTAEVERRFRARYIPAQELYFATARPADHADIIVRNDKPARPAWQVRPR
jgi:hypothetical protein